MIVFLVAVGCDSKSAGTSGLIDGAAGAGAMDGAIDIDSRGDFFEISPCPSLQTYCANHVCTGDWSSAQKPTTWCTTDAGAPYYWGFADVYVHPACNGFNIVVLSATDTGIFYLYDIQTGQLVGIGDSGLWGCVAGTIPSSPFSFVCGDGPEPPVCGS